MKYFLDTEFIESGSFYPISLLSIALVSEDDRELYLVNKDADVPRANAFVKDKVLPSIDFTNAKTLLEIKDDILKFLEDDPSPEFWGYFSDYDWVIFAQLFGDMSILPKHFPFLCLDIKQLAHHLNIHNLEALVGKSKNEHNALSDAQWNKNAYDFLTNYAKNQCNFIYI